MVQSYSMQRQESPSREPALRVAITGGTAGLGLALVREFSRRGAAIAFVARGRERLELVAREIPWTHGIVGDLARKEDIHPVALQITGSLGGLDVLVNNASSLGPVPLALLADTECEELELALATNLVGPFRLTRALLGALSASARQGRGAVILNITSDAAINPYPQWGVPMAPARRRSSILAASGMPSWRAKECGFLPSTPATWIPSCMRSRCRIAIARA